MHTSTTILELLAYVYDTYLCTETQVGKVSLIYKHERKGKELISRSCIRLMAHTMRMR